jgi:hypothetical protein
VLSEQNCRSRETLAQLAVRAREMPLSDSSREKCTGRPKERESSSWVYLRCSCYHGEHKFLHYCRVRALLATEGASPIPARRLLPRRLPWCLPGPQVMAFPFIVFCTAIILQSCDLLNLSSSVDTVYPQRVSTKRESGKS